MKTFVLSLAFLGILAVWVGGAAPPADRPSPLRQGKVLILANEYTMQGEIERVGDRYRVQRNNGETWVPAARVLALTASLADAHAYLHRRINRDDPDERLRLARWCRSNGLQQQALAELKAAAALRPEHAETRRLLQYWTQLPTVANATAPKPASKEEKPAAGGANTEPSPVEVTSDSLGMFATRVQPILMNACARCHATGRGGQFHLTQVFEDNTGNRQTLERNLAAVLAEVNVNQPEASRLLIKAISDHAHTGQAPLRDRQSVPYRTLEKWVNLTVANNPHLHESKSTAAPAAPPVVRVFGSGEPRPKSRDESEFGADAPRPAVPSPSPLARGEKAKPPSNPATATPTADPYDPEPFNRKMHPEAANKSEPGK